MQYTDAELRAFAEKRAKFWRVRCLSHANSLHEAQKLIVLLQQQIFDLEEQARKHAEANQRRDV
jgi:hypothetical protein